MDVVFQKLHTPAYSKISTAIERKLGSSMVSASSMTKWDKSDKKISPEMKFIKYDLSKHLVYRPSNMC